MFSWKPTAVLVCWDHRGPKSQTLDRAMEDLPLEEIIDQPTLIGPTQQGQGLLLYTPQWVRNGMYLSPGNSWKVPIVL